MRNRCVHYEIRDKSFEPDPSLPMHGIVEAIAGLTYEEFDADVRVVTDRLARLFASWRSPRT